MKVLTKAEKAPILKYTGNIRNSILSQKVLKKGFYFVKPQRISGEAPKDFICVYEFGRCLKRRPHNWVHYIAKVGHKWYPLESITEHLVTRLGQVWGFQMANSKLYVISSQIRFCSEYFLKSDQELVHGADILSSYLQEVDSHMIEQIDKNGWSQELLTFQFVFSAIQSVFPDESKSMVEGLIKLLLFDAIVGNNDRHFFNWGVIRNLKNQHLPTFSPIYDSARALFWNESEDSIVSLTKDSNKMETFLEKYSNSSKPKIGWEGQKKVNHFQLIEKIASVDEYNKILRKSFSSKVLLQSATEVLFSEFERLIGIERRQVIIKSLEFRLNTIQKLLNKQS